MKWRLLKLPLLLLLLLSLPLISLAEGSDSVEVTVTVSEILMLEYVGSDPVVFNLTADDIDHGSLGLVNQGYLDWWSNTAPWTIYVKRTCWDLEDYGADGGVQLKVKYGPPDYDCDDDHPSWQLVDCEVHHEDYDTQGDPWVEPFGFKWVVSPDGDDDGIGNGTYPGVDWQIKRLDWSIPPDTYTCTVTFTIAPD